MSWFQNLKILKKLAVAFFVLLAISSGLGLFALSEFGVLHDATVYLARVRMPSLAEASDLRANVDDFRLLSLRHSLSNDAEELAQCELSMKQEPEAIQRNIQASEKGTSRPTRSSSRGRMSG
jgi:methyl-accepting chemotaxis protein